MPAASRQEWVGGHSPVHLRPPNPELRHFAGGQGRPLQVALSSPPTTQLGWTGNQCGVPTSPRGSDQPSQEKPGRKLTTSTRRTLGTGPPSGPWGR